MERVSVSLLVLLVSPILAQNSQYGPPSSNVVSSFSGNNNFNRNQDAGGYQNFGNLATSSGNDALGGNIAGPKVFRHISLFVAPQEQDNQPRVRTIRPQGGSDKHVQIIFVKAPSTSSSQQTEVILPEQPEQKTLVYVLVKKPEEATNNVRIKGPAPTKPPAPEVYFIKYKDAAGASSSGGYSGGQNVNSGGNSFGVGGGPIPVRSSGSLSSSYGAP